MLKHRWIEGLLLVCLLAGACAGCSNPPPAPTETPSPTASATLTATASLTPSPTSSRTLAPSAPCDRAAPWGSFPGPRQTAVTQVPPPFGSLPRPDEVRAIVLLGTDRNSPFVSRTDAIQLFLYHPRLARASLISLPPDMLVYIPGFTMQRLQTAYALGGWRVLADTLQYNFGIRPNHYVLVHLDEFTRFVDKNLGGLDVTVYAAYPDPKYCGGIPGGTFHMTGTQVLCYIRFREGSNEGDRNQRQQDIFRLILLRMVQNGNLTQLPELFKTFGKSIETDLTLADLLDAVPLTLRLGDARRIAYYYLGSDELSIWRIPEDLSPAVFLPVRPAILPILVDAMNFIQTPAPFGEIVKTYEAAMTRVPSATITLTPSITPIRTNTLPFTLTPSIPLTPSITFTPSDTPSITPTGPTPTPSITPTGPTATPAPTSTPSPSPTTTT